MIIYFETVKLIVYSLKLLCYYYTTAVSLMAFSFPFYYFLNTIHYILMIDLNVVF